MKRFILTGLLSMMMIALAACGSIGFFNAESSIYNNFTAQGEGREYEMSGKAHVLDTLNLLYISALEDTDVDMSGELKSFSGDIQIVYINPDKEETVLYDSHNDTKKGRLKINTRIHLDKGESRLEFRGKDTSFKFDLLFSDIDEDKFEYFSASAEEALKPDEGNFELGNMEAPDFEGKDVPDEREGELLKELSVTYTNQDDNCSVLNTSLDKDTKIAVLLSVIKAGNPPFPSLF